jgi:Tol biopolymer transport system component
MRRATIAALLGAVLAVATAPAATVARPPSLLLFNALPDVETAFGVVRPTGKSRRILSREYSAVSWSPSGRQILAYGGPTGLAILDATGVPVRPLSMDNGFLTSASWSPHGPWLAGFIYRCKPSQSFCADLQIKRTDGSEERTLVSAGVLALGAGSLYEWAPDGRALAYSGSPTSVLEGEPTYKGLVIISLTGQTVTRPAFRDGAEPTWAPGGRRLAFSRNGQVYAVGRDGNGLKRLSRGPGAFGPSWSPDGRRIAYLQGERPPFAVQVLNLRRSRRTRIATVHTNAPFIWSPDGSRLAWTGFSSYDGAERVVVARADGRGNPREITVGEAVDWR